MNGSFRQSMNWLHTWSGLVVGWVLYLVFVTGTAGYFDTEIDRWMKPEIPRLIQRPDDLHVMDIGERYVREQVQDPHSWYIDVPSERYPFVGIGWRGADEQFHETFLDPVSGEPLTIRDSGGGQTLYRMHYELHYMPYELAYWLVMVCTMFMFVAIISGIVTHKKIFKDFFSFRPFKGQRSWLDMHNVLSVLALPFHLMITYSGLLFLMFTVVPATVGIGYGWGEQDEERFFDELFPHYHGEEEAGIAAPMVPLREVVNDAFQRWPEGRRELWYVVAEHPGDVNAHYEIAQAPTRGALVHDGQTLVYSRTGELVFTESEQQAAPSYLRSVLLGLHEGQFAGLLLRWVYFFSGLLGTAMVATGLVLWTVKRRNRAMAEGRVDRGLLLVERLNVGTIVGLPLGIAVYFWANRLLPVGVEERAAWEVLAMFLCWGLSFVYAVFRPVRRGWIELLGAAALLYGLLPLLNVLTTERHLGHSLPDGDWVMAGFDLTMLALGLAFACAARALARRDAQPLPLPARKRAAAAGEALA
ncbi:MAG TPA: PepSY-associated TM helix domain-containing protein [Hyphomicrobiales bacterium]|nr:PepSY-associated TM helix domain-containing protein [Hyphomicrobiales bacterium]